MTKKSSENDKVDWSFSELFFVWSFSELLFIYFLIGQFQLFFLLISPEQTVKLVR